jgi:uncharacterized protein (DUF58 family)
MPTRDAYAVGGLALLLFFVAYNLQSGWVYAVDALLVGFLIAGFSSARHAVWRIALTRTLPAEAVEGEQLRVGLSLRAAGGGRRFFVRILDAVPGLQPAEVAVAAVGPERGADTSYVTTASRRGVHRVDTAVVISGGLTGLFEARREVPVPGRISVFPRYWKLSRFPLAAWTPASETVGSTRRRGGLEFLGLRDYRAGDSVRHVHWRSSARRGALVVREFEQEIPGSVTLVIDTRSPIQAGRPGAGSFEDLIRAAASITWYVTSRGGTVRLLASTRSGILDVNGGWNPVMRALAELQAEGQGSPRVVFSAAAIAKDQAVIVLSADPAIPAILDIIAPDAACILADPASYAGQAPVDARGRAGLPPGEITGGRPAVCIIRNGDDIGLRLEQSLG